MRVVGPFIFFFVCTLLSFVYQEEKQFVPPVDLFSKWRFELLNKFRVRLQIGPSKSYKISKALERAMLGNVTKKGSKIS